MIKAYRFFRDWFVPPKVLSLLLELYYDLDALKYNAVLSDNVVLKDRHKGDRCFIVANGPSINGQDLIRLKNEIVFSVSNGYHHKDYDLFRPKYHFVPALTYSDIPGGLDECRAVRWFSEMHDNIGNASIFLSVKEKRLVETYGLFHGRKIYWLYMSGHPKANMALVRRIMGIYSVPIMAILSAIYMGFAEIYLLGVEHDFICSKKYGYFFNRDKMIFRDPSVKDSGSIVDSVYNSAKITYDLFGAYMRVKDIGKMNGVRIINLTNGGLLDVFDRASYDDIISSFGSSS